MKRFLLFLYLIICAFRLSAQALDSIRVSLITCSPGKEVYQLYGHTALRCENYTRQQDVVFNYGIFSFRQPHFVWRFVRGKCDYMVMGVDWKYFPLDYEERGSGIVAQELNLTRLEANLLYANLMENCRPENCEYRYNFLYNNCTTKVRDMIENAVRGRIAYPQMEEKKTYRQILHEYTAENLWAAEGNDFLLGGSVDTILSDRAAMFAPEYMKWFADGAQIYGDDGSLRPLVKSTENILQKKVSLADTDSSPSYKKYLYAPLSVACLFLLFCVLVVFLEKSIRRMVWIWDVVLLLAQGLVGMVLLFMFFFSEHPAVDSNWLLWPFSPLALFAVPVVVLAAVRRKRTWWHSFQLAYLTFFIIFSHWIPQDFGQIVVPLALALLTRPVSYQIYYKRNRL